MKLVRLVKLFLKEFIEQIRKDPMQDWAATLAFYFMLAIFPFLIFILALISYIPITIEQIHHFVHEFAPSHLAQLFIDTILEVVSEPKGGLLSFGILASIWTASNGINALVRALNKVHNVDETRSFVKLKMISIFMTLGIVITFFVILLMPVFGDEILRFLGRVFYFSNQTINFLNYLRWIISVVIMITALMLIYYIAPNKNIAFRHVVLGAITATLGWLLISYGFSIYIANFNNFTATYGALGGVIILMFWFYLSGFILIIGGEINATLYNIRNIRKKSRI
ncbi:YihY/virulence factor BrkB family protein [Proteinivorax hydrogeniformans]|uniref:YihY/virulence factor BrkB family protein n=1 Tax=Proteinivorax hydrogeniformans TaxID=1826727 RepID=A0AAU8HS13_9FIRM